MYKHLFKFLLSILLDIYLKLLVNLVLIFEDSNHAILHPHQLGTFAITLSIGLTR